MCVCVCGRLECLSMLASILNVGGMTVDTTCSFRFFIFTRSLVPVVLSFPLCVCVFHSVRLDWCELCVCVFVCGFLFLYYFVLCFLLSVSKCPMVRGNHVLCKIVRL